LKTNADYPPADKMIRKSVSSCPGHYGTPDFMRWLLR